MSATIDLSDKDILMLIQATLQGLIDNPPSCNSRYKPTKHEVTSALSRLENLYDALSYDYWD